MHLILKVLGGLRAVWDGQAIPELTPRKDYALLIYLAMNPGRHSRGKLAGLLWGGMAEAKARRNLRHALWNLRHRLDPELLDHDRLSVGLSPDVQVEVDAAAFAAAVERGEQEQRSGKISAAIPHYATAIDLYTGDFLSQLTLSDAIEFEEWAARLRARLREQALTALGALIAYWSRRGAYALALRYARKQVTLEPLWEEGHVALMRLLARTGQRDAALRQYESCRQILEKELGLAPLEETRAL
ncbi:MAG: hypothetical protein J7M34_13395 [Anaerolineae bacterium]|nr:hypothetical protein [Anaerolineae bacterium]